MSKIDQVLFEQWVYEFNSIISGKFFKKYDVVIDFKHGKDNFKATFMDKQEFLKLNATPWRYGYDSLFSIEFYKMDYSGKSFFNLTFDHRHTTEGDILNLSELFINFVKEKEYDTFIHFRNSYHDLFKKIVEKHNGSYDLIPTGKNGKLALEILNDESLSVHFTYGRNYIRFGRVSAHAFTIITEDNELEISFYSQKISPANFRLTVHTKSEFLDFVDSLKKQNDFMIEKQEEIIEIIKKYAPSSFYDGFNIRLFEEKHPFEIVTEYNQGKVKYTAKTLLGKRVNKNLDKLMDKIKTETETYMKKHRVKAVVSGKTNDNIYHLFKKIYAYTPDYVSYEQIVKSSFTKEQLNNHLKPFIEEAVREDLDKKYIELFMFYLRSKKIRNRVKYGYKIGDLYIFHSSSKLFIYKEDEFITSSVENFPWKTKKDKDKLHELLEWKKNLV